MLLHYIGGFILKEQTLVKGNIIRLEKGMKIKVQVPTKILYVNRPFSNKLEQRTICLGDILVKRPADTKNLEISILEIFEREGLSNSNKNKISSFVESLDLNVSKEEFDTSSFIGEYIVFEVRNDSIVCIKNDDSSITVEFNPSEYYNSI